MTAIEMPAEFEWDEATRKFIKSVQNKIKNRVVEPEPLHKKLASFNEGLFHNPARSSLIEGRELKRAGWVKS